MNIFEMVGAMGHEQILFCNDPEAGYRGIIAIHSTVLGPAVGGTRFWNYATEEEALTDALRLSRGMTYKAAAAGVDFGGGKSVLIGDNKTTDREALFRAHGRFVDRLWGRYITAEDVGTSAADMAHIRKETKFVGGLETGGGDPSPLTALGVMRGMQAAAKHRWGTADLSGRRVAIQGCGNVGYSLAKQLHTAGVELVVADIDSERAAGVAREFSAQLVSPEEIYGATVDVFAPCALGAIINDATIPMLKAEIIAGSANNQLLSDPNGDELERRGILYAPDYVVNAGGIISGGFDFCGWSREKVQTKIMAIYDTTLEVFAIADRDSIPTYTAANRLAEARIAEARLKGAAAKGRQTQREKQQNA